MVINDVRFDVFPDEVVALVGESGSGKSVTAKAIMRLLPAHLNIHTSGQLELSKPSGEVVDLLTASSRTIEQIRGKDMTMIFQESMRALNPARYHWCCSLAPAA